VTVPVVAALDPQSAFVQACYIVSFSLFILGIRRGTHPTTAKQGNLIAAAGMVIAVATTLALKGIGNWGLIAIGLVGGSIVGIVASRRVQMTAMPQMVALYNGVGGGAVALIAWAEFRHDISLGEAIPLDTFIPILLSMVIGSVSFWGSNIAFGKLQGLISGQPVKVPGQQVLNGLLLVGIVAACIVLGIDHDSGPSQGLFIAVLIAAAILGNLFVLSLGGCRGNRTRQHRPDRRRNARRLLGNNPDPRDGHRHEPLGAKHPVRRLRSAPDRRSGH
jgi:NAD(P) transhydrogenase subunit beta